jgi:chromosome segregation ATPase
MSNDAETLAPCGEAMVELVRLREREREAHTRVDEVGRQAREASAELAAAREQLTEFERKGDGRPVDRRKLEQRLAETEARATEPWRERRAGAERGAQDARTAVARYAAEHLDELVAAIEEDGRAAAQQVDHAAEQFLHAVERRAEVDRQLTGTVALTRRMRPGTVARAKSDEAVREVQRMLERGGEAPPTLRIERPTESVPA